MSVPRVFPWQGKFLRLVVTHTGYRPYLYSKGLDKNLDDVANEVRSGANFELLHAVKEAWVNALSSDCGRSWGEYADSAWDRFQGVFQRLVRELDTSALSYDVACEQLYQLVFVPELSGLLRRAGKELPGINLERWWSSPFASWITYVAGLIQQSESSILNQLQDHLGVDTRSIERWVSGEVVGSSLCPYRDTAKATLGSEVWSVLSVWERDRVTGWLMLAVTAQSITQRFRDVIRRDFALHDQHRLKSVNEVVELLKREAFDINGLYARQGIGQIITALNALYSNFGQNKDDIAKLIEFFSRRLDALPCEARVRYQFFLDFFSARFQANIKVEDRAIGLYEKSVNGSWWYAGPRQHEILREALIYAVGIGDKVKAEHFWDKCYLLGVNRAPKKALDTQELRRISFEFERMFHPLKAKHRVPPPLEFVFAETPFSLSTNDLKNPNQKQKFAEGRTRRTPLMRAVMEGQLSDVIQVLEAGGDPNDYIKESGEGPFIYALRRACTTKDSAIIEHLLTLPLTKETLNRTASTKKETPLKIALEMGDVSLVQRLVELGAEVEQKCFHAESALCYAMFLLHDAVFGDQSQSRRFYLSGLTPGDGSDAKAGAILDCELAARRQASLAAIDEPWKKNLYDAVHAYFAVSPDAMKAVIRVLLSNGADPNKSYTVPNHPLDQWTPTLYAAQHGDLELFKEMLAAGGNPDRALQDSSPLERKDAMWVAITYGQHQIVNHLQTLTLRH